MTFSNDLYTGTHVLVVGGTGGIGAAIAADFERYGAQVLVTGATADEVARASASSTAAVVLDVRDGAAVRTLIAERARLDVVVYCAGVIRRGDEHDPEIFADQADRVQMLSQATTHLIR